MPCSEMNYQNKEHILFDYTQIDMKMYQTDIIL